MAGKPSGAIGGKPRKLTDAGVSFLDRHPDAKLFRFHVSGHLRGLLKQAMEAAGLAFARRQGGFLYFLPYLRDVDAPLRRARHVRADAHRSMVRPTLGRSLPPQRRQRGKPACRMASGRGPPFEAGETPITQV